MVRRFPTLLPLLAMLLAAPLGAGCHAPTLTWEGTPGQRVELERSLGGAPIVTATDESGEELRLVVDTGHPFAVLADMDAFGIEQTGESFHDLDVFGLQFRDVPVLAYDLWDHERSGIDGIVGFGILQGFAFDLDYVGEWAALSLGEGQVEPPEDLDVGPPIRMPFTLTGADGSRVALEADIEGEPEYIWVDTGTGYSVAYSPLLGAIDEDPERPRLGGLTAFTVRGLIDGFTTRLRNVSLGQRPDPEEDALDEPPEEVAEPEETVAPDPLAAQATASLELKSLPVLVFPGRSEPIDLVQERVALSIGSNVLERYATRIDYVGQQITLRPHNDQSRFLENPWRTPGFAMAATPAGVVVGRVYEGSDAEELGVEVGDALIELDGRLLDELSWQDMVELRNSWREGDVVGAVLERDGEQTVYELRVDDQLPEFD